MAGEDLERQFEEAYYRLFSYRPRERGVEVVSLRVVVRSRRPEVAPVAEVTEVKSRAIEPVRFQRCFMGGAWREVPCYEAAEMAAGAEVVGPALIQQEHSALVVRPGWRAHFAG